MYLRAINPPALGRLTHEDEQEGRQSQPACSLYGALKEKVGDVVGRVQDM